MFDDLEETMLSAAAAREPMKTILIHLQVKLPASDRRTADEIADALGLHPGITIVLAEEIEQGED